jgi:hypothetical protein
MPTVSSKIKESKEDHHHRGSHVSDSVVMDNKSLMDRKESAADCADSNQQHFDASGQKLPKYYFLAT